MPRALPFATGALALALLPGLAAAQDGAFARIDTSGDGLIQRQEVLALREAMFLRIDTDGSGAITEAEIAAAREAATTGQGARANSRIWQQDANGDGRLTLAEYTSRTRGFDMADRDGDGVLDRREFSRVARFVAALQ